MRRRKYKGRITKRYLPKCKDVCRTYDPLMTAYANLLSTKEGIEEFQCNVYLDGIKDADYTTDFYIKKTDGTFSVRECLYRSKLEKPMYIKMLEISRRYWLHRGIVDWGIVINDKK